MHRYAFSLIELVMVLTISTLVMAAVTVNWTASLYDISLKSAVEALIYFDETTRSHAIANSKPCVIVFYPGSSEGTASRWNNGREYSKKLQLGKKAVVSHLGPTESPVTITPEGTSPNYYVAVAVGERTAWLLFYGGTGQSRIFKSLETVKTHLQRIETTQ
jgi:prepilin-type N-terminal cleavage/methylation domain-containing protein